MPYLDLIPVSYRKQAALRRAGRTLAVAGVTLLSISTGAWLTLEWAVHKEERAMQAYQMQAERTASFQGNLRLLSERKSKLEQAFSLLATIRGTREISNALHALDVSLNEGVWLLSLQIDQRRERMEQGGQPSGLSTPPAKHVALVQHGSERWRIHRTLQLSGMAANYNAVADFIQALAGQPSIVEVKLLNSGVTSSDQRHLFTFSAVASLLPDGGPLP